MQRIIYRVGFRIHISACIVYSLKLAFKLSSIRLINTVNYASLNKIMNNLKELKCWTFKSSSGGIDGLNFTIWNNVIVSHYLYDTIL